MLDRSIDEQSELLVLEGLKALQPPQKVSCAKWAVDNRVLTSSVSARPGRFTFDFAPYQEAWHEAVSDPKIRQVVLMTGAQSGKTNLLLNTIGWIIDADPANALLVFADKEQAKAFSREKLDQMIDDTPSLSKSCHQRRQKGGTRSLKAVTYEGGNLAVVGSNSPNDLRSRSIKFLLLDEVDMFRESSKDGSPIANAIDRTTTFYNSKIVMASTPTIEGASRIAAEYELTDRRVWLSECPHCSHRHELEWDNVRWEDGKPETASYHCPDCGTLWDESDRIQATRAGRWVATDECPSFLIGFRFSALSSPWCTLQDIVRKYLLAKGDPNKIQSWQNNQLGLPYEPESGAGLDADQLRNRAEDINGAPAEAAAITAGVDVQKDRFEVTFSAWGLDNEAWILDHVEISRVGGDVRAFEELEQDLRRVFSHPSGKALKIDAGFIDSGYQSDLIYDFAKKMRSRGLWVFASKGMANQNAIVTNAQKQIRKSVPEFIRVGVNTGKAWVYGALNNEAGPNSIHLPRHLSETDFFDQLIAEKYKIESDAFGSFKTIFTLPSGKRNEALDCVVLCRAAWEFIDIDINSRLHQMHEEAHAKPQKQKSWALELGRKMNGKQYA